MFTEHVLSKLCHKKSICNVNNKIAMSKNIVKHGIIRKN